MKTSRADARAADAAETESPSRRFGGRSVFDLVCLALIALFFAVSAAFARGCEKLEREEE